MSRSLRRYHCLRPWRLIFFLCLMVKKLQKTFALEAFVQSDLLSSTALREDEGGGCDILKGVQ